MKFGSLYLKAMFVLFIACAHIFFLFHAYSTDAFGLPLPYMLKISIWLGFSSVAAGIAYYFACSGAPLLESRMPKLAFAVVATCISLYAGVFLAFNVFGT